MMNRLKLGRCGLLIATLMVLILSGPVQAYFSYGARSTGMGGAYTAMANDASAVYWNPGNLGFINGWTIEMQIGQDGLFAEDVRDTMEFLRTNTDSSQYDSGEFDDAISDLSGKDWLVRGGDTLSLVIANQYTAFHFTQYNLFYGQPEIIEGSDIFHRYEFSGIEIKEYGVTFTLVGGSSGFSIGVTGKYIDADVYHWSPAFWEIPSTDPGDLYDELEDRGRTASDSSWGLDAGLAMSFGSSRLGFTARNIIGFEIEIDEQTRIEIEPEYRLGYAFQPSDRFVLSMDYSIDKEVDLLGNKLEGSELATGFEAAFGQKHWLLLRGGVSMPMDGDASMIFSVGAGLNFKQGILDVGYAFDQERDSEKLWGGVRFTF